MLDPSEFMRALHLLSKTEHVDFYAMDNNLDIANMAASSFIMANKCSTVHSVMTMQYLQATGAPRTNGEKFFVNSSRQKITPASGALNAAARPAPAPAVNR